MSQVEDAIARLAQVRGRLGSIRERLWDIEARLAAATVTDTKQPALISLREFTSNFLAETPCHSPRTTELEEYRAAAHQFARSACLLIDRVNRDIATRARSVFRRHAQTSSQTALPKVRDKNVRNLVRRRKGLCMSALGSRRGARGTKVGS
jgi:hypothetical protein